MRVNLHRLTRLTRPASSMAVTRAVLYRRKLKLKAKFESGSSCCRCKRLVVPGAFKTGLNL
jgi:hypothetical protein